jgi:hypothetical protein
MRLMKDVAPVVFFAAAALAAADIDSPAGVGSEEPFLSVDHRGGILLSWLEPRGRNAAALRYARFNGSRWSEARSIATLSDFFVNWADFPSIVSDGRGRLFAHWLQKSGSGYAYDVRLSSSGDGGKMWSAPILLHRDGKRVEHGFVSLIPLANGVAAAWLDGRNMLEGREEGEMTLRYAEIRPDGSIGSETMLDSRVCECCTTAMARTAAGPIIAYRDRSADEIRDIAIIRRVNGKWTEPAALHGDGWKIAGCPVNGPQIEARGSQVAVAWFTAANGQPRVNVAFSSNSGKSFAAPIRIDQGIPIGRVELLLLGDGSALVVWMETSGPAARVLMRRVQPSGKLGALRKLADTTAARSSGFPRAALVGKTAYFVWTESGPVKRIRLAKIAM